MLLVLKQSEADAAVSILFWIWLPALQSSVSKAYEAYPM